MRYRAELKRVLALGALIAAAGCDSLFGSGGNVQVVLSRDGGSALGDAVASVVGDSIAAHNGNHGEDQYRTSWSFQTATVEFSSIMARTLDGQLVSLDVELPIMVDVVKIDGGRQVALPDGFLPADTYDQIVLVMTAVQGTLRDGTLVTVQPPGGGWTAVIPICPLEVSDAATSTVGVAFNVRNSFVQLGSSFWGFQPRFRSINSLSSCATAEDDEN
jgi:hypothetical protein